jgi:hypothetical protein
MMLKPSIDSLLDRVNSKYTEHIHKFKYRQGNRRTGEHPRVVLSIHNLAVEANHQRSQFINI